MRHLVVGVVAGLCLLGAVVTAAAQPTKSVSGTITAVGPDSVTVKVKDQDMKFTVDHTTDVITHGGTTATLAAKSSGKSGPALGTLVKPGQHVEVKYHEQAMHAASVRVLGGTTPAPATTATTAPEKPKAPAEEKPKSMTASGTVTAMTGSSLTVKTAAGDSTFSIDTKTKIIGTGLGTKSKEAAAEGKKQVLADVIGVGDSVSVTYHDVAGAKHAAEVRLRQKAAK